MPADIAPPAYGPGSPLWGVVLALAAIAERVVNEQARDARLCDEPQEVTVAA